MKYNNFVSLKVIIENTKIIKIFKKYPKIIRIK